MQWTNETNWVPSSVRRYLLLLFLLRSPAAYLWCSPFWVRFLRMSSFFNPTFEVVTLRLRGWWLLGVFLLPAFTRHRHECQNLLSPCDGMHVCTDWTSVYTLIRKSFGVMESEPMLTPREKSPLPEKILLERGSNPRRCIKQDSEPNTLPHPSPPKEVLRDDVILRAVQSCTSSMANTKITLRRHEHQTKGQAKLTALYNLFQSFCMHVSPGLWQQTCRGGIRQLEMMCYRRILGI